MSMSRVDFVGIAQCFRHVLEHIPEKDRKGVEDALSTLAAHFATNYRHFNYDKFMQHANRKGTQ